MHEEYATQWKKAAQQPYGLKGHLRKNLRNLMVSALALTGQPGAENSLRCLYCHYVFDDQKEQFAAILTRLKKVGTFVDTDTCLDMLAGRQRIDARYFHLSFDDGFRNNFTNALPILQREQVPAIFFVPSAIISADWETTQRYCLVTTHYRKPVEMLRWDDLKEMAAAGYEIGSHTKTHARLSEISSNPLRLADEIAGSKHQLESNLGRECKYISWPFGSRADADPLSLDHVRSAGYKACFGAFRGAIAPEKTPIFSIPRHHFEVQWPIAHITYFLNGNMEANSYAQLQREPE